MRTRQGASVRVLWVLFRRMFFIKFNIKFDNGSCYLIVHVRACLGCRGGQGRGCLSVMVGVVGGILLSSCPLASLSCPPSLSPLSLSLSLVWISCLVRSRQPRWEQWSSSEEVSPVFVIIKWGHRNVTLLNKLLVETFSCIVEIITYCEGRPLSL